MGKGFNLKIDKIYEEIPFEIENSPLDLAYFNEYQDQII